MTGTTSWQDWIFLLVLQVLIPHIQKAEEKRFGLTRGKEQQQGPSSFQERKELYRVYVHRHSHCTHPISHTMWQVYTWQNTTANPTLMSVLMWYTYFPNLIFFPSFKHYCLSIHLKQSYVTLVDLATLFKLLGWCSGSGVGLRPGCSRFKIPLGHDASWVTLCQTLSPSLIYFTGLW